MYATWLDYNIITNTGANKEVLKWAVPSWANTTAGYVNRGDVMSLSTPSDKISMLDAGSTGIVYGGWAKSWGQYGAHPALYCFKIY